MDAVKDFIQSAGDMRKLKVFVACSIDGFIADENGSLDFLETVQAEGEDYGYAEFCKDVDTVIIGRKTYDTLVGMNIPFPHEGLMCYVFTHTRKSETRHVKFITEDPVVFALGLKSQRGGSIYCDGGGSIITQLVAGRMVDELVISVIPVLLGKGTRLFQEHPSLKKELELVHSRAFKSGLVQMHFRKK
jgi:dihydrofolate reductase